VLGKRLQGPNVTICDVLAATDYVVPAIEIIDARIEQFDRHTKTMRKVVRHHRRQRGQRGIVMGGRPREARRGGPALGQRPALQERRDRGIRRRRRRCSTTPPPAWPGSPTSSRLGDECLEAGEVVLAARSRGRRPPCLATPSMPTTAPWAPSLLPLHLKDANANTREPLQASPRRQARADRTLARPRRFVQREICAGAGFDWLLLDGEHTPNDLQNLLQQAQVDRRLPGAHAIARVPMGHGYVGQALIKQYLDLGIQTLLVPMVDTPSRRASWCAACATRPTASAAWRPRAPRAGAATPTTRRKRTTEVCLLVQAETREAHRQPRRHRGSRGVDGVFIGPADLSASMGTWATPAIPRCRRDRRQPSAASSAPARRWASSRSTRRWRSKHVEMGATFIAVGTDTNLLLKTSSALASAFKGAPAAAPAKAQNY
jgi:4-hydroxy-2-oxoheptanedioate aldolase